jgi:sialate O-acetylesterase
MHSLLLPVLVLHSLAAGDLASAASFSANFGSGQVLQREPAAAAVYGFAGLGATSVAINLDGVGANGKAVHVAPKATLLGDGTWKALLPPQPAGGNFSVSVSDAGGTKVISDVTFGDVWYCSGQSNMELSFKFTFERNSTMKEIAAGRYDNVRVYLHPHVASPRPLHVITGNESTEWRLEAEQQERTLEYTWTHVKDAVNSSSWQDSLLLDFSAACLYMGVGLTEHMNNASAKQDERVPLGLMGVSWGGTLIEQWVQLDDQFSCKNISCFDCNATDPETGCTFSKANADAGNCPGNGALFNGMVAPFVNMSVFGFVWYQVCAKLRRVSGPPPRLPLSLRST